MKLRKIPTAYHTSWCKCRACRTPQLGWRHAAEPGDYAALAFGLVAGVVAVAALVLANRWDTIAAWMEGLV